MSSRTPTENKALAWYCEANNLIPQLSAHPVYFFRNRAGEESKILLEHIVQDYQRARKEEIKEAKRVANTIKRDGLR